MAEDWFADVQKHVADADEGVVKKIVSYLGIALRNRDSSLVSFSDPEEVGRVRERFLRKKLGLTDPDGVLDKGLDAVRDMMAGDRTKNRVTVYYLLADWFGKLDLFGGSASAPGSFSFGSTASGPAATYSAADLAAGSAASGPAEPSGSGAASTAAGAGAVAVAASTPSSASARPVDTGQDNRATTYAAANVDDVDNARGGGFPSWLMWLLVLAVLALLFFLFRG